MRNLEAQKLQAEGFIVSTATNGHTALTLLKKNPEVALIVLDLVLPEMSGYDLLETIKKEPTLAHIPVLIVSNLGQAEDVERAMKLGAKDYIIKANATFAEIIKKIHEIIG